MVLLMMVLTTVTAWAETETVSYIDADGNQQSVTATILTGSETYLSVGWYAVKNIISYTNSIGCYAGGGTIHIILCDGAEMSVNGNGGDAIVSGGTNSLAIYGQSKGTGRLTAVSTNYAINAEVNLTINGGIVSATGTEGADIYTQYGDIIINGGQVTASGSFGIGAGGTITLGLRKPSDFITSSRYNRTVTIKSGQTLYDESGYAYSGDNVWIPGNKTLRNNTFDYTIHNAEEWNEFCDALENNAKGYFDNKVLALAADISVTRMAGTNSKPFTGYFDGAGHTLTVSYTGSSYVAPFSYVDGATIKNLVVDGTISSTSDRAAGVIGETNGSTSHIINCVSSSTITGGNYTGGFSIGGNVEIEGCVFDGTINGNSKSGGFVGYSQSTLKITNCLFAPKSGSSISGGTFYYKGGADITPTNSYYTAALGDAQGTKAIAVNKGYSEQVTPDYSTSGIKVRDGYLERDGILYAAAGASVTVGYVNENGSTSSHQATVLGGTYMPATLSGWYCVADNITYTQTVSLGADANIILADGCTMSIGTSDSRISNSPCISGSGSIRSLTIYGQSGQSGKLNAYNEGMSYAVIVTNYAQHGGNLTATGSTYGIHGTSTLSWTSPADRFTVSSTSSTVTIADGKSFYNGSEVLSSGKVSDKTNKLNGKTLIGVDVLEDAATNDVAALATRLDGKQTNIALSGRTLYKDGAWNTLCLPFDVTVGSDVMAGATAMTLRSSDSGFDSASGVLTLNFDEVGEGSTIAAGTPFIVKWTGTDVTSPVFSGVTVSGTAAGSTVSQDGNVRFQGTYSPTVIYSADHNNLYLGAGNTLYWPSTEGYTIGACRAWFHVDLNGGAAAVRQFVLNFDGDATGVRLIDNGELIIDNEADAWYTLDGRKLPGKPTAKGIYIHQGKKRVITGW